MTAAGGYVRLHRDLLGHPAFRNDGEAMAFAWLFARAAWKPCRVRYKGRAVSLGRGQLAISVRDMGAALDRDKAWVERLFKRLRAETMIETVAEAGVTVVTICNFNKYQGRKDTSETAGETLGETGARQARDTEQEGEEGKKEVDANASTARGRFPTPEGVTDEQFRAFRQQRKKTLTDRAYTLLCNKLSQLAEAGWPPGEMIDLAIERGWETVFEPKEGGNGSGRTNGMGRNQSSDGLSTTARAAMRAFGDCDEPPRPGH